MFQIVEDAQLTGVRETKDGYLTANVNCARTGIQQYAGYEFGLDVEILRVWRPEDEVFSSDSMRSYAGKPATNDHPRIPVSADNWKDVAVGSIGSDVLRNGEFVQVSLALMDAEAIADVKGGKREISMGYLMDLDLTSGVTEDGQEYDAIQRNLKMNHLAIVQKGRAGSSVRIGDSWGPTPNTNDGNNQMNLQTVTVDGLSVSTTDAGAQAIAKLQSDIVAVNAAKDALVVDHEAAIAALKSTNDAVVVSKNSEISTKDAELVAKDTEIKSLKESALDDAAIDARVSARSAMIEKATKLVGDSKVDFTGKSDLEIKTAAVTAVHGADACKDKDPTFFDVAFDLSKVVAGTGDPVRDALIARTPAAATAVANDGKSESQIAYEARLANDYKGAK